MVYPSDLTDKEWLLIKEYFEQKRAFGRPLTHERRSIVNAILYVTKSGCQWRMLPKDFPPWETVYYYFKQWRSRNLGNRVGCSQSKESS